MARSVQWSAQLPRPPKKPTFAPRKPTRWRVARAACTLHGGRGRRGVETRRPPFKRARKSRSPARSETPARLSGTFPSRLPARLRSGALPPPPEILPRPAFYLLRVGPLRAVDRHLRAVRAPEDHVLDTALLQVVAGRQVRLAFLAPAVAHLGPPLLYEAPSITACRLHHLALLPPSRSLFRLCGYCSIRVTFRTLSSPRFEGMPYTVTR